MTQTEALKLALEALEQRYPFTVSIPKAITAIKEALANHIPDATKMVARQSNEQVEPVAWVWKYSDGDEEVTFLDPQFFSKEALGIASTIPLYTHPPVPTAQPKQLVEKFDELEQPKQNLKLMPREATPEMLKAMDECSMEGYDERLYAGHGSSVYMAAWDAAPTPPQRKPLPQGEWPKHPSGYVGDVYMGYGKSDLDKYAMQVLAAHGIKE